MNICYSQVLLGMLRHCCDRRHGHIPTSRFVHSTGQGRSFRHSNVKHVFLIHTHANDKEFFFYDGPAVLYSRTEPNFRTYVPMPPWQWLRDKTFPRPWYSVCTHLYNCVSACLYHHVLPFCKSKPGNLDLQFSEVTQSDIYGVSTF